MVSPRSYPPKVVVTPLLSAALACLAACQQPQPDGILKEPAEQPKADIPDVPRLKSLDRLAILSAVARAASSHAAGTDDSVVQRTLDGRQFDFRIRFGCRGPSAVLREQWLGWSLDQESRTLRVRARPTVAGEDPLVQVLGGSAFEAVEGFWIPRPWLLQPICPARSAVQTAPIDEVGEEDAKVAQPLSRWPRIGIAQFFSGTDPRTGRRSMRPYEAVRVLNPDQLMGSYGFDLVLTGRLKALPDKRVIACLAKGPESPPDCIVSVVFDRVWIEAPASEVVIAEWSSG